MPDTFEVDIDGIAHGGSGTARHGKRTVRIPYTIPGERVLVRPTRSDQQVQYAAGVRLLDASADRVYPRCQHFGPGKCGRCQWQHIDYAAQLLLKQDLLAETLETLGGITDDVVSPVIPAPEQWGYNTHMTFTPVAGGLGLPSTEERRFTPIEVCHVLHPDLLALYQSLDLETLPDLKRLKLQIGSDSARMLVLFMNSEEAPELEMDIDASINLLLPDNEPVNLLGDSHTRYRVHDRMFRVTAGSYYRANARQVPALVDGVLRLLTPQPGDYVLDLYAGVGVFGAFLARHAEVVTVVESYPPAATDAENNLSDLDNVDVIEGTVENVLAGLDGEYDAAVVDPSAMLSDEALESLNEMGVKRIAYVSGDMIALARDSKRLIKYGYHLDEVQPYDLAPQTFYLDSIALFTRP
jgi:23S rRNA (uracil1939-C5)-methyltransferase